MPEIYMHMEQIKKFFMLHIGFLEWAVIEGWQEIDPMSEVDKLAISPDVHSLHIIWTWKGEGEVQHEMADYSTHDGTDPITMLENEVGDDIWDSADGPFEDYLTDYSDDYKTIHISELVKAVNDLAETKQEVKLES